MSGSAPSNDSPGVVEVRFALSSSEYPFVAVSEEEDCRVELVRMIPREPGVYGEFFVITGAGVDRILELADATDPVEARLIDEYENGSLFEFTVSGFCPAQNLAATGAFPREVVGDSGEGRIVVEIPAAEDETDVIRSFLDDHPSASLDAKHKKDRQTPIFTENDLKRAVGESLTDRQQEVLLKAYEMGYYERPREATGGEIAEELDIAPATVSNHLRAAEEKVISILVSDVI